MALVEQHGAARAALGLDVEAGHAVAQLGRRRQHAFALGRGGGEVELDAGDDAAAARRTPGPRSCAGRRRRDAAPCTLRSRPSATGGSSSSGVVRLVGQHDLQAVELAQALGEPAPRLRPPGRRSARRRRRRDRACIWSMSVAAAARSVGQGLGRKARRMVRASSGRSAPLRAAGASSGAGAVPISTTGRPARSARWIRRSAWAMRVVQPGADDQPSSITSSKRAAARQVGLRVEQRPGDGQDQRRRQQQAQQQQPPRHLHRRLLGRLQPDQQPDRREAHQLGQRRDQAQQPVDHRQRQQQRQHAGCGEGEGAEAQHAPRARTPVALVSGIAPGARARSVVIISRVSRRRSAMAR